MDELFKKGLTQGLAQLRRRVRRLEIIEVESGSTSGSGEVNTASNVGVGGYGWYARKDGTELEFKNIIAASDTNTIYLIDDTNQDEIEVGVVASNIDHTSLSSIGEDDHHTAFVGLKDDSGDSVNPRDSDDKIRIFGDGIISCLADPAGGSRMEVSLDETQISHTSLSDVGEDDHHTAFVGLLDNAGASVDPRDGDDRIQFTDDGVINADVSGGSIVALTVDQAQISHDSIADVSEDDHHAAFIGLEDNAGTDIDPPADNRIQVTDDGIVNADADGDDLALSIDESQISYDNISDTAHAADHITGGTDEVDGDKLDIDWNPSNYTPSTTPAQADSVDNLTAHLYGIDDKLGAISGSVISSGFSVNKAGSSQSINATTLTQVTYASEGGYFDTDFAFSYVTSRYTAPCAGFWLFNFNAEIDQLDDGEGFFGYIYKNGGQIAYQREYSPAANTDTTVLVSKIYNMNGLNDYVDTRVYHTHGASLNLDGGSTVSFFQGFFLGVGGV